MFAQTDKDKQQDSVGHDQENLLETTQLKLGEHYVIKLEPPHFSGF